MKENSYMTKFINFKGMHRNAHEILSILTKLSCAVLVLTALGGCTVGMFGDMGGEAQAQIVGKTYSAVSPENVQIKDLIPAGGDSVSSATVSSYESTVKGEKVAQLMVKSTGVIVDCCVWRGQGKMAYPDGRQDHQPFWKEWIRHGKEYRS